MRCPYVVIFDLGGVLVDWDPRYLYRKLFGGDAAAMEHFLANVCTHSWNEQQDAGRTFAEACALLKAVHPDKAQLNVTHGLTGSDRNVRRRDSRKRRNSRGVARSQGSALCAHELVRGNFSRSPLCAIRILRMVSAVFLFRGT